MKLIGQYHENFIEESLVNKTLGEIPEVAGKQNWPPFYIDALVSSVGHINLSPLFTKSKNILCGYTKLQSEQNRSNSLSHILESLMMKYSKLIVIFSISLLMRIVPYNTSVHVTAVLCVV